MPNGPLKFSKTLKPAWVAAVAAGLAVSAAAAASTEQWVTASRVLSGDSFKTGTGAVVSYASVRAPDLMSESKRIEDFAEEAREFHRALVEGRRLRLEFGARIRNSRGHYLVFAYLEDGTFVNLRLLEAGFAKLEIEPPGLEHAEELRHAARRARREKTGLWRHEPKNRGDNLLIGDIMKNEFHDPNCPFLERVPPGHRRTFRSRVDAVSQEFHFCSACKRMNSQATDLF